jgi:hypothetical protein
VQKMITVEEKTRERFSYRNNRDNSDRQNHRNNGCENQWTTYQNTSHYPLVLDPTIAGMTIKKY